MELFNENIDDLCNTCEEIILKNSFNDLFKKTSELELINIIPKIFMI